MYVPAEIVPEVQVRVSSTEQKNWDPGGLVVGGHTAVFYWMPFIDIWYLVV